jgi:hypothetical protein
VVQQGPVVQEQPSIGRRLLGVGIAVGGACILTGGC